jgi:hypothetical protein
VELAVHQHVLELGRGRVLDTAGQPEEAVVGPELGPDAASAAQTVFRRIWTVAEVWFKVSARPSRSNTRPRRAFSSTRSQCCLRASASKYFQRMSCIWMARMKSPAQKSTNIATTILTRRLVPFTA